MNFDSELNKIILKLLNFYIELDLEFLDERLYISSMFCPRCGITHLSGEEVMNAVSKLSPNDMNFYICNECAIDDKASSKIEDLLLWAIANSNYRKR